MVSMKSTTKLQISILAFSSAAVTALFAVLAIAPSILWTSNTDWSGGTFSNITGDKRILAGVKIWGQNTG
ncbi:MAG: hypothetical protein WA139_04655 [Candidatus Aenigmatarchaeota archaeon]